LFPELAGGQQTVHRRRQWRRAGMLHFISLLQVEIDQSGQTAIAIFALHKCGCSAASTAMAVPGLAFDGDLGIAEGNQAESQRAAQPADGSAQRHEGEEHQHAVISFETHGFKQFEPG
jgi:hypothetical protein